MRGALLLVIAALPLSAGCSAYIADSGTDLRRALRALTTREQVHAEFGQPVTTGTLDGQEYDEFRIPFARDSIGHFVSDGTFRFVYGPAGRVTSVSVDVDEEVRVVTPEDFSGPKTAVLTADSSK
jgi:hypothetical protein